MPALPQSEPSYFTAGDTVQWQRNCTGYSPFDWTLKYALQASGKPLITVTADADGTCFTVSISAATSADYAPGVYLWTAFVEGPSGARHTVERGTLSILPSPLAVLGTTHASRMLALIEAALEGRIPNGLETTNIDGQELARIPLADLATLQARYQSKVAAEANAARLAAGLGNRRNIFARFTRPS